MAMTGKNLRRKKSFREDFKSAFFTGVGALLPTILTLLILVKALEFVDWHIGRHIRTGMLYIAFHAFGAGTVAEHLGLSTDTAGSELFDASSSVGDTHSQSE